MISNSEKRHRRKKSEFSAPERKILMICGMLAAFNTLFFTGAAVLHKLGIVRGLVRSETSLWCITALIFIPPVPVMWILGNHGLASGDTALERRNKQFMERVHYLWRLFPFTLGSAKWMALFILLFCLYSGDVLYTVLLWTNPFVVAAVFRVIPQSDALFGKWRAEDIRDDFD